MGLLKTEGPAAGLAVEVDVEIIVGITFQTVLMMAVAYLVADALASVLYVVQEMVLPEQGQGAGYDGFVHGPQGRLDFRHADRTLFLEDGLEDEDPVCSRLYSVFCEDMFFFSHRSIPVMVTVPSSVTQNFML